MKSATADRRMWTQLRDAAVAFAVFVGLYALGNLGFPPGYFFIAGVDTVEAALRSEGFAISFGTVLLAVLAVLSVSAVFVADRTSNWDEKTSEQWWTSGLGGALAVLGMLTLGFVVAFLANGAGFAPTVYATIIGLGLLVASRWALDR